MVYFRLIEDLPGRSALGFGLGAARWNSFGCPMIYTCSATALNFLELLAIKGSIVTQSKWKLISLKVEGEIQQLDSEYLSPDWTNRPYPSSTQEFGTQWAKSLMSPVLKIPSCRIPLQSYPHEHNLLINPLHPDFNQAVKFTDEWDVSFEVNS